MFLARLATGRGGLAYDSLGEGRHLAVLCLSPSGDAGIPVPISHHHHPSAGDEVVDALVLQPL
jgi:hypothetical protein